jgi:capsid protein
VTNATRQGARVAARAGAVVTDVEQSVLNAMTSASMGTAPYQLSITPGVFGDLSPGDQITVIVTVPYADVGLGMPLVPTPDNLEATVIMVREGPSL